MAGPEDSQVDTTGQPGGDFVFRDRFTIRVRMVIVGLLVSAALMAFALVSYQVAQRAAAQSFYLYDTIFHTANYGRAAQRNLSQLNGFVNAYILFDEATPQAAGAGRRALEGNLRASLDEAMRDWFDQYRQENGEGADGSIAVFFLSEAIANLSIDAGAGPDGEAPQRLPPDLRAQRAALVTELDALRPEVIGLVSEQQSVDRAELGAKLAALSEDMEIFLQNVAFTGYLKRLEAGRLADVMGYVILGALAVTLALSVLAAFLAAEGVRRGILHLSRFAQRVEQGHLDDVARISGRTELTMLMGSLDRMRQSISRTMTEIDGLRREADRLLESVLPPAIVSRLRRGETRIADARAEATIVFLDLTGFTELTRRFGASHLIDTLDTVFHRLDEAAERNGIEKIKTVGDAYLAAAGVTCDTKPDDAARCARFALEGHEAIREIAEQLGYPLNARTGIHNGAVVSGILGKSNLVFDVWGDAVNLAARIQTSANPGEIRLSEAAYWRLRAQFDMTPVGPIELKGIGKVPIYLLDQPS